MTRIQRTIALLLILLLALPLTGALAQEPPWDEDRLNTYLMTLAEGSKDPGKSHLPGGADNLSLNDDVLTFFLRALRPTSNPCLSRRKIRRAG